MKILNLFILLSLSSLVIADDAAIERYINTHVDMVQAQVDQLNQALSLLTSEGVTAQEAFEKIGQPSFKAVDDALQRSGFTHNNFYQFAHKNKTEIDEWLITNTLKKNQITVLEVERDRLMQEYDQVIKPAAITN